MVIPEAAVEAAARKLQARFVSVVDDQDFTEWEHDARSALNASVPHILRSAADYLEGRMNTDDPTSYAEQQYQAGYADAVARLILFTEGKSL